MTSNLIRQSVRGLALLLGTGLVAGCDSGTSVTEFGAGGSTDVINAAEVFARETSIELSGEEIEENEFHSASFVFDAASSVSGRVIVWTQVVSGPPVEVHVLDEDGMEDWASSYQSGSDVSGYAFSTPYPLLSNIIDGEFETDPVYIETGTYEVVVENTDAGSAVAVDGTSVFNLIVLIELLTSDGDVSELRVISTSKVKIGG